MQTAEDLASQPKNPEAEEEKEELMPWEDGDSEEVVDEPTAVPSTKDEPATPGHFRRLAFGWVRTAAHQGTYLGESCTYITSGVVNDTG